MDIYYIYEITNKINRKTYIGQRKCPKGKTPWTDVEYMGSGKLIHISEKKHGIKNFNKEIIAVYYSRDEVNILEKEYIALYRSIGKAEYNIADGGSNVDSTSEIWRKACDAVRNTEEYHAKLRNGQKERWSDENEHKRYSNLVKNQWKNSEFRNKIINSRIGHETSDETRRKIGERNREIILSKHLHWYTNGIDDVLCQECPEGYWKGKSHTIKGMKKKPMSEEQKDFYRKTFTGLVWWNNGVIQMRARIKPEGFVRGKLPGKIKRCWFTNGVENVMSEICPEGFYKGRTLPKRNEITHFYTNGIINIRSKECPDGFVPGMLSRGPFTEEHKRKLSESHKKK